ESATMRILITGGQGQLGRALQTTLEGDDVTAPGHADLDVTDRQRVQDAIKHRRPDTGIHAAAWTDTLRCEDNPTRAMRDNGEAPGLGAEACQENRANMLDISGDEDFDDMKRAPAGADRRPS